MADGEARERVSPDSSTHVLKQEKRKHKKKKKEKHKSKKRKRRHSEEQTKHKEERETHSSSSSVISESDERLETTAEDEFAIDIKPLNEYIDDRKQLNNELFKILERKEMKKLMPKSVKKLDMEELKSRCLDLLEIMSKKRLLKIMQGEEMNSSSTESETDIINGVSVMEVDSKKEAVVATCLPITHKNMNDSENILEELSVGPDQHEIDELVEGKKDNIAKLQDDVPGSDLVGKDGESQVEARDAESQLLELEFRARALKSLMKTQQCIDT